MIELSPKLLTDHGWGTLVEVLKHEMAHQFVAEVLGVLDESSHGPVYRKVCEERGIDSRAAGIPEAGDAAPQDQVLERIQKLLALAESQNEHEAQAAMEGGEDIVEGVPMPGAILEWVEAFVAALHVEEPFRKRKRR